MVTNETFMLIALCCAITAVIIGTVCYYVKKKPDSTITKTAKILACIGDLVTEVYDVYKEFGGIDRTMYDTDEGYRELTIKNVISVVKKELEKNDIDISDTDVNVLNGIAVIIIEKIFDKQKLKANQKQIEDISSKLEKTQSDDNRDKLSTDKDKVSISLGDFYKED